MSAGMPGTNWQLRGLLSGGLSQPHNQQLQQRAMLPPASSMAGHAGASGGGLAAAAAAAAAAGQAGVSAGPADRGVASVLATIAASLASASGDGSLQQLQSAAAASREGEGALRPVVVPDVAAQLPPGARLQVLLPTTSGITGVVFGSHGEVNSSSSWKHCMSGQ